jgi:hypothetical protein
MQTYHFSLLEWDVADKNKAKINMIESPILSTNNTISSNNHNYNLIIISFFRDVHGRWCRWCNTENGPQCHLVVPIFFITAALTERRTSYAFTTSTSPWHARFRMFFAGAATCRWLTSIFATGDATRRWLSFMLSSMSILSTTRTWSSLNSSWQWPPHLGHHLIASGGATYHATYFSPSLVTQLANNGDWDSTNEALIPIIGFAQDQHVHIHIGEDT